MYMDKQSAREMVESVLWWERQVKRAWNFTLGRVLGKAEIEEPVVLPTPPTLVVVEEIEE